MEMKKHVLFKKELKKDPMENGLMQWNMHCFIVMVLFHIQIVVSGL